jgi:hypothetical protein
VTKVGTSKPERFKVLYVEDDFEGRTEWVSRAKLQCPWPVAGEWLAARGAWTAAAADEPPPDDESEAVDRILDFLLPRTIARREHLSSRRGLVTIVRPDLLADLAHVPVNQVVTSGWWHDQVCTVPWTTTLALCENLVRANRSRVVSWLRGLESASVHGRTHGDYTGQREHRVFIPPGVFGENYDDYEREMFELLQGWLGLDLASREYELAATRRELDRVLEIAQSAVSALRASGQEKQAWALQRNLRPQTTRKQWRAAASP